METDMNRTLTITFNPDWEQNLRKAAVLMEKGMETGEYQGEYLNFSVPSMFFSRLTGHRWNIVNALMGQGQIGIRELARRLGRDPKNVMEDTKVLVELGLLEKTMRGAVCCPYARIEIAMALTPPVAVDAEPAPEIHPGVIQQPLRRRAMPRARTAG